MERVEFKNKNRTRIEGGTPEHKKEAIIKLIDYAEETCAELTNAMLVGALIGKGIAKVYKKYSADFDYRELCKFSRMNNTTMYAAMSELVTHIRQNEDDFKLTTTEKNDLVFLKDKLRRERKEHHDDKPKHYAGWGYFKLGYEKYVNDYLYQSVENCDKMNGMLRELDPILTKLDNLRKELRGEETTKDSQEGNKWW